MSAKIGATLALAATADVLFYGHGFGTGLGVFALAWVALLVAAMPAVVRTAGGRAALAVAIVMAAVLADDPSLLGWVLFWSALASAVVLVRHRFGDALGWGVRLLVQGCLGLVVPVRDVVRVLAVRQRRARRPGPALVAVLAVPLIGGAAFLALFAMANPLIADALAAIRLPVSQAAVLHLLLWIAVALCVWPSLRPFGLGALQQGLGVPLARGGGPTLPGASLLLSLVTFNALFAVQNLLDIVFLWSGAPLPGALTMADYAHRGAYALIATALLAGLFVLAVFRPGHAGTRTPLVRPLVVLWIAQNLLLVASSMLRTLDYVGAYGLTILRVSALAWMALVGAGLVLICVRLLFARSARWLINANAGAAAVLLVAASVIDLGSVAASWDVAHGRRGAGPPIDLCYLRGLGPSALVSLARLERRTRDPVLRDRVRFLRQEALERLVARQADWHLWTARNARRLATTRALLGPRAPRSLPAPFGRDCDGSLTPPPPPPPPPRQMPLTKATLP